MRAMEHGQFAKEVRLMAQAYEPAPALQKASRSRVTEGLTMRPSSEGPYSPDVTFDANGPGLLWPGTGN